MSLFFAFPSGKIKRPKRVQSPNLDDFERCMSRPNSDLPQPIVDSQYVSTAQVALALGVSVTTVKRWVDDGTLPAHRTAGGHRKLLVGDVLRAVRDGNLPKADLNKLLIGAGSANSVDVQALYEKFVEAVAAVDPEAIRELIHTSYRGGMTIDAIADQLISPALKYVGQQWEKKKMDVHQEHRITQSCVGAIYELRAFLRKNAENVRPVAVGGAPEHDHYILPSLLSKLTLIENGWDAINLGPHTPMSAFHAALEELSPQLIWVSVSHIAHPDKFLAEYTEFFRVADKQNVAVAIGGGGLGEFRSKMPYTTFGDGLTHLASFARSFKHLPQPARRGRPSAFPKPLPGALEN